MENQIVDVNFDDGVVSICKIKEDTGDYYVINELIYMGNGLYTFKLQDDTILKSSVNGFYDVDDIELTGMYTRVSDNVYERVDESDEDYEVSSEDYSDTESDVSLEDEE